MHFIWPFFNFDDLTFLKLQLYKIGHFILVGAGKVWSSFFSQQFNVSLVLWCTVRLFLTHNQTLFTLRSSSRSVCIVFLQLVMKITHLINIQVFKRINKFTLSKFLIYLILEVIYYYLDTWQISSNIEMIKVLLQ